MNFDAAKALEYGKVKERIMDFAMSYLGKGHIERMQPLTEERAVRRLLDEAAEAMEVIRHGASVPVPSLEGIQPVMNGMGKGLLLTVEQLLAVAKLLESTEQLKRFMAKRADAAPGVASYAQSLYDLKAVRSEIERCLRNGGIADQASAELGKVRKKIGIAEERIKKKLEGTMLKYRSYLQEVIISMRGGRYVLPVKKEYRKMIHGAVLDESSSGQTVFVEPSDIGALTYELNDLRASEAAEEMKVLGLLTDTVEEHRHELGVNLETIGHYDFLFAKAKYARSIDGRSVELNTDGVTRIRSGRHPLLGSGTVPLDFEIGEGYTALIITGPNTGGKTVTLKTVGLLTMMVQSGLPVPVGEGSTFALYTNILADIGDGQSLEQSLSTFSSHIKNVIHILRCAGPSTLVLLDELASGTDPGEGIGLSIAVLEELKRRGATLMATTHFNEIKRFAEAAPGFENASMQFDPVSLRPLYRLTIGQAGSSYAFQIAQQLGIEPRLIARANEITYGALDAGSGTGASLGSAAVGSGLATPGSGSDPGSAVVPDAAAARDGGGRGLGASTDVAVATPPAEGGLPLAGPSAPGAPAPGLAGPVTGAASPGAPGSAGPLAARGPRISLEAALNPAAPPEPASGAALKPPRPSAPKRQEPLQTPFSTGDCVWVHSLKRTGIVCGPPDAKGDVPLLIQKERVKINHKRLSLYISKEKLYPEGDYDMDIVFESKDIRKQRKQMMKRHDPTNIIVKPKEE
ncbi:endonuclease MutS2 [Paenibacillus gansuensis]|uniref:DNA mismatch repair protein MutS n=1 Tax=Paenibacillus gansuensis TaxID=306542 RepID=A0ABW5PH68_9BACL